MERIHQPVKNRLLDALSGADQKLLKRHTEAFSLDKGEVLFEPGDDVVHVFFPGPGMIASFIMNLRDGATTETAMIGQEGAVGGVVSQGDKPAFARAVVQFGGNALRIPTDALDAAKHQSATLRDHFARYADCLLAQVLQSVACNAVHEYEARLARWLLTTQDRVGSSRLAVTHQFASEMLGVQRTYTGKVIKALAESGAIETSRGIIEVKNRKQLEGQACECYDYLRRHYERLLPGIYPSHHD